MKNLLPSGCILHASFWLFAATFVTLHKKKKKKMERTVLYATSDIFSEAIRAPLLSSFCRFAWLAIIFVYVDDYPAQWLYEIILTTPTLYSCVEGLEKIFSTIKKFPNVSEKVKLDCVLRMSEKYPCQNKAFVGEEGITFII